MMPLWITTTSPVQSRCGCALFSFGLPCVAQRVWPMPNVPLSGHDVDAVAVDDGDAGAVVPAILKLLQSPDQNRDDVTIAYVADDSAHVFVSFRIRAGEKVPSPDLRGAGRLREARQSESACSNHPESDNRP